MFVNVLESIVALTEVLRNGSRVYDLVLISNPAEETDLCKVEPKIVVDCDIIPGELLEVAGGVVTRQIVESVLSNLVRPTEA